MTLPAAREGRATARPTGFRPLDRLDDLLPVYARAARRARRGRRRVGAARRARARQREPRDAARRRARGAAARAYAALGAAAARPAILVAAPLRRSRRRACRRSRPPRSRRSRIDLVRGAVPAAAPGLDRQDARRRRDRRPQHLARRPRRRLRQARGAPRGLAERRRWRPRPPSSTCRTTSTTSRSSTRPADELARLRRPEGRPGRGARPRAAPRDAPRSRPSSTPHPPPSPTATTPPGVRDGAVRERAAALDESATSGRGDYDDAASRRRTPRSACRRCRRRRSARSRRPATIRTRARPLRQGRDLDRPSTRASCATRSSASSSCRRSIGLDVLVHGEPERNDMVQYFAENLDGFAVTQNGWVQSYGSRATRPSILWGDVSRPAPITVALVDLRAVAHREAGQGHAHRPGDDPRLVVRARRPAARRDRQPGRPRPARRDRRPRGGRHRHHPGRRAGAARAAAAQEARPGRLPRLVGGSFRLATAGVADATQIHTHLCYSEFGVVIDAIDAPRRRRHLDRGGAQPHGGRRRPRERGLRPRHRAGRLRHPLAARAERRRGDRAARARPRRRSRSASSGSTRTAAQDPRLRRDRRLAREHPRGDPRGARARAPRCRSRRNRTARYAGSGSRPAPYRLSSCSLPSTRPDPDPERPFSSTASCPIIGRGIGSAASSWSRASACSPSTSPGTARARARTATRRAPGRMTWSRRSSRC